MPAKPIGFNPHALVAIRTAAGRTADDVCTSAQCSPGFYSRLEAGKRAPSLEVAQRLAGALGCDVRALVPTALADEQVAA